MQLENHSEWSTAIATGWSKNNAWQYTLVVKAGYTFDLSGELTPMAESDPVHYADEFRGEPDTSSLMAASDIAPFKQGFELMLHGHVEVPEGATHHQFTLALHHGERPYWQKTLALFGSRQWQRTLLGASPGEPHPITDTELTWERAFGGTEADLKEDDLLHRFDHNPAGLGWSRKPRRQLTERPLPHLEQPPFLINPKDTPAPAGFGPLPAHWSPRLEPQQRLDSDKAMAGQCPYPPGMASTLFNAAPVDQQLPAAPQPGDVLQFNRFYQDNPDLRVPLVIPNAAVILRTPDQPDESLALAWDTLIIDTDARTLHWVGRAGVASDPAITDARQCVLTDLDTQQDQDQGHTAPAHNELNESQPSLAEGGT